MIDNKNIKIGDTIYYYFDADLEIFKVTLNNDKLVLVNVVDQRQIDIPTNNDSDFSKDNIKNYYADANDVIKLINNDIMSTQRCIDKSDDDDDDLIDLLDSYKQDLATIQNFKK